MQGPGDRPGWLCQSRKKLRRKGYPGTAAASNWEGRGQERDRWVRTNPFWLPCLWRYNTSSPLSNYLMSQSSWPVPSVGGLTFYSTYLPRSHLHQRPSHHPSLLPRNRRFCSSSMHSVLHLRRYMLLFPYHKLATFPFHENSPLFSSVSFFNASFGTQMHLHSYSENFNTVIMVFAS